MSKHSPIATNSGDFLTFASLAGIMHGRNSDVDACESPAGRWERAPEAFNSRSTISRDGILGLLHYALTLKDAGIISRLFKTSAKSGFKMGKAMSEMSWAEEFDYTNLAPFLGLLLLVWAKIWGVSPNLLCWIPTVPTAAIGPNKTGYRAHLLALIVWLKLRCLGWRRIGLLDRWTIRRLVKFNPDNPFFLALKNRLYNRNQDKVIGMLAVWVDSPEFAEGCFGWGSCPPEVFLDITMAVIIDK